MFSSANDLTALTGMLTEAQELANERAGASGSSSSTAIVTPGSITASHAKKSGLGGGKKADEKAQKKVEDSGAIWDEDEVDGHDSDFDDDGREVPDYDVLYKQKVGSEDVYLGMGGKTPLSQDCNFMVVKVSLPGSKLKNIDLNVERQKFVVQDPTYRLATYLPYPTKEGSGKAKWNGENEVLTVTLPIDRE